MASSDERLTTEAGGVGRPGLRLRTTVTARARTSLGAWRSERAARWVFIWPALFFVLGLSIFPLVVSLILSISRLEFVPGHIEVHFLGLENYLQLLLGSEQAHFLGVAAPPNLIGLAVYGLGAGGTVIALWRTMRTGLVSLRGLILRTIGAAVLVAFLWLVATTLFSGDGRPGTLMVTFAYVILGVSFEFLLGLGLALLCLQNLAGRRFFRVVFLLPMTITPVGVGYMFRMLTDTTKGPFYPIWTALGLQNFSWTSDPWGARLAVIIGDVWQWTPFMFIVLLAALAGQAVDTVEAALVDGASRWQIFRHITLPAILPVSATVILIRLIEGFKIIDLPNILTSGGPGTATESLTLESFFDWRTLNLGRSAAIAYLLLIVVTVVATAYVSFVRRRAVAAQ